MVSREDEYARHAFGQPFDAAGEVYPCRRWRCIRAACSEPIRPTTAGTGMDADADVELDVVVAQLLSESLQYLGHLQRRFDAWRACCSSSSGAPPEGHDGVTDEFVQRAAVPEDHLDLQAEIAVQQFDDLLRVWRSDSVVKPRMSENSTVIWRLSPARLRPP